jgi:phosphoribosylformylglycinamidine synthase subunit PurL
MSSATPKKITPEIIAQHGITPEEYEQIKQILGRAPNVTELGIFSVMWSEHCSYKNSRPQLKKFPVDGPTVLVRAGEENAGVIDIGDGWAIAFKMESHNHPSAVEPFQGAATGVGGILRDIFTMGARPIFSLDSLRFGDIRGDSEQAKTNRRLLAGVVSGIAHYGNCIGVPTVGGEIYFDDSYNGNPLVNVFSLGVLRHEDIRLGKATGTGNPVFYVGNRTGRDGLAGAAFASRDLTEDSKADRPAVQVGDPFIEKLLLEACLELFKHPEAVVGIQDMGAAGLTCSTCETASRGNSGIEIDLKKVPQREPGMTPYETMLSESQERMLIIVHKGQEQTVLDIFRKWDLPVAEIGEVTDDGMMRVKNGSEVAAEIPARKLADEAPIYHRQSRVPANLAERRAFDFSKVTEPADYHKTVLKVAATPSIASKRWIYRQYDHMVRVGSAVVPGSDSAVIRFPIENGKWKYLAASVDCNAKFVASDPYRGALIAVAECARNIAVSGGVPLALTDNLNFGNPHDPEIFWELEQSVNGLADGCRFFNTPVTGGNVSLYNQNPAGAIDPTPTVGMVGLIDEEKHITSSNFKQEGDAIILLGDWGWEVALSAYVREIHGIQTGEPPQLDLNREKRLHDTVRALIRTGNIRSAHDLSEGGLAVALVESCFGGRTPIGATVELPAQQRLDVTLFNESLSRVIVTTPADNAQAVIDQANNAGVTAFRIGTVGGNKLIFNSGDKNVSWGLEELYTAWGLTIDKLMEK